MQPPRIVDETQMPPELDAAIRRSLVRCFPHDQAVFSATRKWHGCGPAFSAVVEDEGNVIAHAGAVDRTIRFGPQLQHRARIAGVQNVMVMPEHRGKGLADAVLQALIIEAARRGYDAGLLFCGPRLERVYARSHWQTLNVQVVRRDDDGVDKPLPGENIAMFLPLRAMQPPQGTIHLQGNDW